VVDRAELDTPDRIRRTDMPDLSRSYEHYATLREGGFTERQARALLTSKFFIQLAFECLIDNDFTPAMAKAVLRVYAEGS
jgi:hypothetical protein